MSKPVIIVSIDRSKPKDKQNYVDVYIEDGYTGYCHLHEQRKVMWSEQFESKLTPDLLEESDEVWDALRHSGDEIIHEWDGEPDYRPGRISLPKKVLFDEEILAKMVEEFYKGKKKLDDFKVMHMYFKDTGTELAAIRSLLLKKSNAKKSK